MLARALVVLLLVAGCGVVVRTTPLNVAPGPRRPRLASEVEVYAAGRPSYPFADVALLEARVNDYAAGPGVIARLREEAGKLGCDALVVLEGITDPSHGQTRGYRASCAVRTDGRTVEPTAGDPRDGRTVELIPPTAGDPPFSRNLVVVAASAVVRVAPATIAPEVVRLPVGSMLAAAGPAERGWYRVRLSDGRLGYAAEGELRPAPPPAS